MGPSGHVRAARLKIRRLGAARMSGGATCRIEAAPEAVSMRLSTLCRAFRGFGGAGPKGPDQTGTGDSPGLDFDGGRSKGDWFAPANRTFVEGWFRNGWTAGDCGPIVMGPDGAQ